MSNSAKPSETVIVPDYPVKRLNAAYVTKEVNIRVEPETSASSKYDVMIEVIE